MTQTNKPASRVFQQATQHHQGKRYSQAKTCYQKVIKTEPRHADAWHLLGLVEAELGNVSAGLTHIEQATRLQPNNPIFYVNRGLMHRRLQQMQQAMQDFQKALHIDSRNIHACIHIGDCFVESGQPSSAIPYYQQVLEHQPQLIHVWHHLGNAYLALKDYSHALTAFKRALTLEPQKMETLLNLGVVCFEMQDFQKAIALYQQVLDINPEYAPAYNNLGLAYTRLQQFSEAQKTFEKALHYNSHYAEAYNHLGVCYRDQNKVTQAKDCFQKALHLQTQYPEADFNLAITELLMGEYRAGWKRYESRHALAEHRINAYNLAQPFWQGESLVGKTLFILAEQGLGDTLQCIRFLPLLEQHAQPQKIIVECQAPLIPLLQPNYPAVTFVSRGQLPEFDVQTHLMSLPYRLQIQLDTIPFAKGYLTAPTSTYFNESNMRKIGLVWAGNPQHKNDHNRSITLDVLKPLFMLPEIQWISLQWGERREDIKNCELQNILKDATVHIQNVADTAAIINEFDLLITIDSVTAHLAGSLNQPAWILLPFAPDFRWLLERSDSPWYHSLRLYRQPKSGDWSSVIQKILKDLQQLSRGDL